MAKRKTTPPPETAEAGIPPAPAWLRRSCRVAFLDHCRRLRDDGVFLRSLDAHFIGRLCHSEEDLQVAESEAAKVPAVMESRANGTVISAIHKRCSELRAECRSWMRQLPRPATTPRTSATKTPTASKTALTAAASTAAAGAPRLELIERIRARIAALQQQQPGNPTGTSNPAAAAHDAAS